MRPFNESLMRELAEYRAPICLSLFMEVSSGGGDHNHIRISMKNAKSDAAEALRGAEVDDKAVAAVQERLDALEYDDLLGGHDRRIAVFIGPDLTEVVDAQFNETGVHAGSLFRLAPLVSDLEMMPDHAILVASKEFACLYQASDGALTKQDVHDMPESLNDVTKFTDQQEKRNINGREDSGIPGSYKGSQATASGSGGTQGVPHHSIGGHDWRESKEQDLRHYANLIINAVQHHLSGTNVPLIVAADERLYGMIRDNSEYPFLAEKGITHHPDDMDQNKLREAAAACLDEEVTKRRDEAWEKIAMSLGRDDQEASKDPASIATAAAAGQVSHLFVRAEATLRGSFDTQSFAAQIAEDGPEDLVDRAIVETLRSGGEVFPLGNRSDKDTLMAAAYRYPT